ncbi:MAG TPA: type II secretion system minor pseudopilin GspK [Steroidobacter sp.]|nr:type II secretion system minor pseudopilin GspK [Steroidobacter sp.]
MALITAVLIVALATILAVSVGFKGYLDQRRTATAFALDQAFEVALGGEAWASDVLRRDAQQSANTDDFTEEWATPIPPIPLEDGSGEFEGVLEDMQGRFNLNSVVVVQGGKFVRNDIAYERFKRLLELLQLEPKWADLLVDWIDSDANEGFPSGAEDSAYTSLTPAHRAANMPVTRTSELLALQDFGMERYRRLEPFISALPIDTQLNLCTAPAEVLDSIVEGQTEYTLGRENMIDLRKQRCFPTLTDFAPVLSRMPADQRDALTSTLTQKSAYFRATIWVTIGTTRYTLYSLLYRPSGANLVRPILRSSGTL